MLRAILVTLLLASSALAYTPPLGIPQPSMDVEIDHDAIYGSGSGKTWDYGSGAEAYRDAGNGPYTHYVDSDHGSATDIPEGRLGTPSIPRQTIPTTLPAGSVVEIHGASEYQWTPETDGNLHGGGNSNVVGTESDPIFIRGYSATPANRPIIGSWDEDIKGTSWLVIENLDFNMGSGNWGTDNFQIGQRAHHILLRNCSWRDALATYERAIISHALSSAWVTGESIDHIVYYQCDWTNNGDYPNEAPKQHGIIIARGNNDIWILDCDFYRNGEDGIQIIGTGPARGDDTAARIYIGDCTFEQDAENAVDVKQSHDVVISSNTMTGYVDSVFSDGSAVVFNDDAPNDELWLINNIITDSTIGIRSQSQGDVYIVGNTFSNIVHEPAQTPTPNIGVAVVASSFDTCHIVNNVMYACDNGITIDNGDFAWIEGNIMHSRNSEASTFDMALTDGSILYYVYDNTFYPTKTFSGIPDDDVTEAGTLETDPDFVDEINGNFNLNALSPAIDSGSNMTLEAYATFQANYGIDIRRDIAGMPRPQNTSFDRGAYEYDDSTTGSVSFSPGENNYGATQNVALSSYTPSSTIYYTTDGSTPDNPPTGTTATYSTPIEVTSTTTIKALATSAGNDDSAVTEATISILPVVATPVANPVAGEYGSAFPITLTSATVGATIYYTVDNSVPNTEDAVYSGAITYPTAWTSDDRPLRAYATKVGYVDSAYTIDYYSLTAPPPGGTATATSATAGSVSISTPP